jgi:hypothetical protein
VNHSAVAHEQEVAAVGDLDIGPQPHRVTYRLTGVRRALDGLFSEWRPSGRGVRDASPIVADVKFHWARTGHKPLVQWVSRSGLASSCSG